MSQILTNNKNYYDIADAIRQMKDVSTTYKPREMASALKDIYSNEVEGVLPLSFESNGMPLIDYRIDGASGGVGERTKNLLQNTATSQTINGVTFTVNEDKSITCNGAATGTAAITINTIFSINSTKISGCPMGGSWSSFELDLLNINTNNVDVIDTGNGAVIQNENSYRVRIRIASGYTCNNLTFYPMIRKADIEDDTYEPYGYKVPVVLSGKNLFDENSELNVNASVDVTSGAFPNTSGGNRRTYFFKVKPNTAYTFSCNTIGDRLYICEYNQFINPANYSISNRLFSDNIICNLGTGMSEYSFTTSSNSKMVGIYYSLNTIPTDIQIEIENIATDYEPYHEPTTTNIYLDEPIEENESISLSDTEVDIPTIEGKNVLTIDTTVQPSNVYIQAPKDHDEIVFLTTVLEEEI